MGACFDPPLSSAGLLRASSARPCPPRGWSQPLVEGAVLISRAVLILRVVLILPVALLVLILRVERS